MPLYDEKYMKAKVREFNVKTNALSDEIPKENLHCACIACMTTDSVMRMKKKKNYPQVSSEECRHKIKKINMSKFINTELESESEIECDIELESKSELESDSEQLYFFYS